MSQNDSDSRPGKLPQSQTVLDSWELPTNFSAESSESDLKSEVIYDSSSFSMDANADRLLDGLFADIERMLERGVQLPAEPFNPNEPSPPSSSLPSPNLTLPPKLAPRSLMLEQPELLGLGNEIISRSEEDLILETAREETSRSKQSKSVDKLLLFAIGISLLVTGALWFVFQNKLSLSWLPFQTKPQPSSTVSTPSPVEDSSARQDNDFLHYVGRSLDRLNRTREANKPTVASVPGGVGASPSPAATGASPAPTVLERVYIPVYQSPLPAAPGTGSPSTSMAPVPESPRVAASAPAQVATAPNITASASHVLIGVLELGDRSAALVETDGTPGRVQIGEQIGSTGWTLVSISNQQAIVRRNGEVRSIYVGQQF